LTKDSSIITLSSFLDENGPLRVGGRLNKAAGNLPSKEINPIALKWNHVSILIIHHFHEQVKHQGRLFTEGAHHTGGYWILGTNAWFHPSYISACLVENFVAASKYR
jgi:hypothetical protein